MRTTASRRTRSRRRRRLWPMRRRRRRPRPSCLLVWACLWSLLLHPLQLQHRRPHRPMIKSGGPPRSWRKYCASAWRRWRCGGSRNRWSRTTTPRSEVRDRGVWKALQSGPSRHRRASSPGEQAVGGLFFDSEAIRGDGVSDGAPPRRRVAATPATRSQRAVVATASFPRRRVKNRVGARSRRRC